MYSPERPAAFELRQNLVKQQIARVANAIARLQPPLPVNGVFVREATDTNFDFYFGTFSRRSHYEAGATSRLEHHEAFHDLEIAYSHIGAVANARAMASRQEAQVIEMFDAHSAELAA